MSAPVMEYYQLDKSVPSRLDPCPADERVSEFGPAQDGYGAALKTGAEGEVVGDDGIHYQKCGGGRRIVRKKIGG